MWEVNIITNLKIFLDIHWSHLAQRKVHCGEGERLLQKWCCIFGFLDHLSDYHLSNVTEMWSRALMCNLRAGV